MRRKQANPNRVKTKTFKVPGIRLPRLDDVMIITENNIARGVVIGGNELKGCQGISVTYGVNELPEINVKFIARDVTIKERGVSNGEH